MGLIRMGRRYNYTVVLFGNFALPAFLVLPLPFLTWVGFAIWMSFWDIHGDGAGRGGQIFGTVTFGLAAVFVLIVLGIGARKLWRIIKKVNGYN